MKSSFFIIIYFSSFILTTLCFSLTFLTPIEAALFEIENKCTYTVWAAAVPGGGRELRQGQNWSVNTDPNFGDIGRIWARTNCNFSDGIGICETGDCDGALYCVSNYKPPVTLAEYSFRSDQTHFFDISLVDGFNVPMEFKATSTGCSKTIKCTADINSLCPTELRDPGSCNNPCSVFQNDQFCCTGARNSPQTCAATAYSKFFKDLCPDVYTYALDDATSVFTCPSGTDYKVVFCPRSP